MKPALEGDKNRPPGPPAWQGSRGCWACSALPPAALETWGWQGRTEKSSLLQRFFFFLLTCHPGKSERNNTNVSALSHLPNVCQVRLLQGSALTGTVRHSTVQASEKHKVCAVSHCYTSSAIDPQNLLSAQKGDFYPSTNSSKRKPEPYLTLKYIFHNHCL